MKIGSVEFEAKRLHEMLDSAGELVASLALICAALVIYFHYKIFSYWSSRGINGPVPWPIFGTNIYYLLGNKIELDLTWKKKYGRTYGLYEGYSPILRTTDCEVLKQVFIKNFSSITDRNCRFIHDPVQLNSMLWSKGHLWANQRALVSPMFTASRMRSMAPVMHECVDRFIASINQRLSSLKLPSWTKFDLSSLTLDVIASSVFGLKLKTYRDVEGEQDEFISRAFKLADFDVARFISWLFIPRQIAKMLRFDLFNPKNVIYFHSLARDIVKSRRAGGAIKRNDVVQALIEARIPEHQERIFSKLDDQEAHYNADLKHEEMEKIHQQQTKQATMFRHFEDKEIQGMLFFFMAAGFETTAATLSFAFYELAHRPYIQERLYEEFREAASGETGKLEIGYDDLSSFRGLDAFVSELLRLYAPLIEINRRVTDESGVDLIVDGRCLHLPKGVPVSTNAYITQHDEEYFERAEEFDMTRFLPENKHKIKTATFMPFGLGPRHCVGMRFALMEVKTVLARVIMQFTIRTSENQSNYPPKFKANAIFLQLAQNSFEFVPRK